MTTDTEAEARTAFNLKALRRHDSSIVQIVETASYVVLYNYVGEWTKTGVEGPMFLVRRATIPYNGFFILNRNGVENFGADVTQDDDLEITPEFIIYRPVSKGDNDIYGVWVFESSQRDSMGQKLLELQNMLEAPDVQMPMKPEPPARPLTAANGKSATKPKKNANKAQATAGPKDRATQPSTAPTVPSEATESVTRPNQVSQISLDDLFGGPETAQIHSARQESPRPKEDTNHVDTEQSSGSLLDSLFQKAASIVPLTGDSADTEPTKQSAPSSTPQARTLLSLLGMQPKAEASPKDAEHTSSESTTTSPQPSPDTAGMSKEAPRMSELVESGIKDQIGLGDNGLPLTRREFVTELLSMIHVSQSLY